MLKIIQLVGAFILYFPLVALPGSEIDYRSMKKYNDGTAEIEMFKHPDKVAGFEKVGEPVEETAEDRRSIEALMQKYPTFLDDLDAREIRKLRAYCQRYRSTAKKCKNKEVQYSHSCVIIHWEYGESDFNHGSTSGGPNYSKQQCNQ